MKKIIAMLVLLSLLPAAAFGENAAPVSHTLEMKTVPVYYPGNQYALEAVDMVLLHDFPLYYADGVADLPYAELTDIVRLMNSMEPSGNGENYAFSTDGEAGVFTCTYLPRKSDIIIDFSRGTLTYSCLDTFGRDPAFSPAEIQTNPLDYLQRIYVPELSRLGGTRTVSLADYGIPMLAQDGKYLLPLHTAFDFLIWAPKAPGSFLCCNGEAVFICAYISDFGYSDAPSELGNIYFSQQPAERSPELAQYGYDELCLTLDSFYGLKDAHHIAAFRDFFRNNGYEERLLSRDPKEADSALQDAIVYALDDFHSSFSLASWMSGLGTDPLPAGNGFSGERFSKISAAFAAACNQYHPDGSDFYTESGNTAYVLLPMMATFTDSERYYALNTDDKNEISSSDAVQQMLYADRQINRENSPIENVVMDLSLNHGGDVNSPACLLSWFLGEGYTSIANTFTGGLSIGKYRADVNRDHQFTEEDTLRGRKRLFCLISPETFSSANMTAAMLKDSGAVTLIGQTTKGGSGTVMPISTGWDTVIVLSGFRTVVSVKNGSWYDRDTGVVPDVYLSDPELFYDRDRLTELINTLY